jgi:flagellar motility protein MotE (MotC chaperone)
MPDRGRPMRAPTPAAAPSAGATPQVDSPVPPLPEPAPQPGANAPPAVYASRHEPAPHAPSTGAANVRGTTVASRPGVELVDTEDAGMSPAQQYCINIVDAATDARIHWHKKTIAEVEQELERRLALLDAKIAEYQKWVTRRDEFLKKAKDSLLGIYSRMRPEAAASQLAALDEETAAAVLLQLDPRTSSAILNEMEAASAARLTATISGAARVRPARDPNRIDDGRKP